MSKSNETTPITAVPDAGEQAEVVKKENIAKRGWNFVKSHKKAAFAVAGLVVLVGASAALGGTSSNDDTDSLTDTDDEQPMEALETADTVTN